MIVRWTHVWAYDPHTFKLLKSVPFNRTYADIPTILAQLDIEFPCCDFAVYNNLGTITSPKNVLVALNFDQRGERLVDTCEEPNG